MGVRQDQVQAMAQEAVEELVAAGLGYGDEAVVAGEGGDDELVRDRLRDAVEHAEIEYSIILERARVLNLGARIESSLVGRDALITRSEQRPAAHRFMVGDSSQIWVL